MYSSFLSLESLKNFLNPPVVWFVIGVVLLLLEFALPGLFVIFFGVGACIVALACLLVPAVSQSINAQLLIFVVSSVVLLLVLRRWLRGMFFGHITSQQDLTKMPSDLAGERAVVKVRITPQSGGRVEVHGTEWKALADEEIAEGTVVEIVEKSNITLKVKPL